MLDISRCKCTLCNSVVNFGTCSCGNISKFINIDDEFSNNENVIVYRADDRSSVLFLDKKGNEISLAD